MSRGTDPSTGSGTGRRSRSSPRSSSDTTLLSLSPGDRIGPRYELVEMLGAGGMSVVWAAKDLDAGGPLVALKLLPPEVHEDEDARLRLLREAARLRVLNHPAIARVYETEEAEDTPVGPTVFLSMERLEGPALKRLLTQRGHMTPDEVVRTLRPIAEALHHAHQQEIVHRDIKPANIVFTADPDAGGEPKLIDFGIAAEIQDTLTRTGVVVQRSPADNFGTPPYMSPEQIRGRKPRPTMDTWSLAVTAYEMLEGRLPFPGPNTRHQILEFEPEPLELDDLDDERLEALNAALLWGLSKEAKDRPATPVALIDAMQAAVEGRGVLAPSLADRQAATQPVEAGGEGGPSDPGKADTRTVPVEPEAVPGWDRRPLLAGLGLLGLGVALGLGVRSMRAPTAASGPSAGISAAAPGLSTPGPTGRAPAATLAAAAPPVAEGAGAPQPEAEGAGASPEAAGSEGMESRPEGEGGGASPPATSTTPPGAAPGAASPALAGAEGDGRGGAEPTTEAGPGSDEPSAPPPATPEATTSSPGATAPSAPTSPSKPPPPSATPPASAASPPATAPAPAPTPAASKAPPRPTRGMVRITGAPPRAEVHCLDCKGVPRLGRAIDSPFSLPVGRRKLRIRLAGYKDAVVSVSVRGGKTASARAQLEPTPRTLSISSQPPGAEVLLGGKSLGKTGAAPLEAKVAPGTHVLVGRIAGLPEVRETVQLSAGGGDPKVELVFQGTISVDSEPRATVFLDGRFLGRTPVERAPVAPGTYQLEVRLLGQVLPLTATVEPGQHWAPNGKIVADTSALTDLASRTPEPAAPPPPTPRAAPSAGAPAASWPSPAGAYPASGAGGYPAAGYPSSPAYPTAGWPAQGYAARTPTPTTSDKPLEMRFTVTGGSFRVKEVRFWGYYQDPDNPGYGKAAETRARFSGTQGGVARVFRATVPRRYLTPFKLQVIVREERGRKSTEHQIELGWACAPSNLQAAWDFQVTGLQHISSSDRCWQLR